MGKLALGTRLRQQREHRPHRSPARGDLMGHAPKAIITNPKVPKLRTYFPD